MKQLPFIRHLRRLLWGRGSQGNTAFAVSVALLLVRLALGWTFIFHGAQHAFGAFDGPGIQGFARMFGHSSCRHFFRRRRGRTSRRMGSFWAGLAFSLDCWGGWGRC